MPFESRDGRTLFYKRAENADCPLLARPAAGGEERAVVGCVPHWGYAIGPEGIFHLECASAGALHRNLRYWDAETGQDRLIAALDTGPDASAGLSASPDGRSVLFTHLSGGRTLMMIENFR